mmetsp:Transcript_3101/g.3776  ORF Transcript_3101/g.3776 Transcript_3101/m.3776 type:complete len:84 (-) Transcript_3101:187-438(-)
MQIICRDCNKQFCLKHRDTEAHNCGKHNNIKRNNDIKKKDLTINQKREAFLSKIMKRDSNSCAKDAKKSCNNNDNNNLSKFVY